MLRSVLRCEECPASPRLPEVGSHSLRKTRTTGRKAGGAYCPRCHVPCADRELRSVPFTRARLRLNIQAASAESSTDQARQQATGPNGPLPVPRVLHAFADLVTRASRVPRVRLLVVAGRRDHDCSRRAGRVATTTHVPRDVDDLLVCPGVDLCGSGVIRIGTVTTMFAFATGERIFTLDSDGSTLRLLLAPTDTIGVRLNGTWTILGVTGVFAGATGTGSFRRSPPAPPSSVTPPISGEQYTPRLAPREREPSEPPAQTTGGRA